MDIFRRGLKVQDGKLFGRCLFNRWIPIAPEDIRTVREYGFNNPFIRIWTTRGTFTLGASRADFDTVTEYLKQNALHDLSKTFVHRWNVAFYRTPILQAVGRYLNKLLSWRKSG